MIRKSVQAEDFKNITFTGLISMLGMLVGQDRDTRYYRLCVRRGTRILSSGLSHLRPSPRSTHSMWDTRAYHPAVGSLMHEPLGNGQPTILTNEIYSIPPMSPIPSTSLPYLNSIRNLSLHRHHYPTVLILSGIYLYIHII